MPTIGNTLPVNRQRPFIAALILCLLVSLVLASEVIFEDGFDALPPDYDEGMEQLPECFDPTGEDCLCPDVSPSPDYVCDAAWIPDLRPFRPATTADKSFLTTSFDAVTGRYKVVGQMAGLRGSGYLVVQHDGNWLDEQQVRDWISDMTGVPVSTGDSLFNFDYVQLGISTAVTTEGVAPHSFNHFFLDSLTDGTGKISIGAVTTDLASVFGTDIVAPSQYSLSFSRDGEECWHHADSEGDASLRAKLCSTNTAVRIGDTTDLGVYVLRSSVFDVAVDGQLSTQTTFCPSPGTCSVRSQRYPATAIEIEAWYYHEGPAGPMLTRSTLDGATGVHGYSLTLDRGDGATSDDGVCTRAIVTKNSLRVRMDNFDGSVPTTCVAGQIGF